MEAVTFGTIFKFLWEFGIAPIIDSIKNEYGDKTKNKIKKIIVELLKDKTILKKEDIDIISTEIANANPQTLLDKNLFKKYIENNTNITNIINNNTYIKVKKGIGKIENQYNINIQVDNGNIIDFNFLNNPIKQENLATKMNEKELKIQKLPSYLDIDNNLNSINWDDLAFICKNISKKYNKKTQNALEEINIFLKKGEITLLVGSNGSGKSTLLKIISGLLMPTTGELNYPYLLNSLYKKNRIFLNKYISYIPQELKPWKKGTLLETLHFTLIKQKIYGQENLNKVNHIIDYLNLKQYANLNWNELSAGYKLRFYLAKAILEKPKLLIMDEPLANLDINMQQIFLNDLKEFQKKLIPDLSIIVTTHHIQEMYQFANKLIVLNNGKQQFFGNTDNYKKNRDFNYFEIETQVEQEKLEEIFKISNIVNSLITKNNRYILKTYSTVKQNELLEFLLQNQIEITYFQDISQMPILYMENNYE